MSGNGLLFILRQTWQVTLRIISRSLSGLGQAYSPTGEGPFPPSWCFTAPKALVWLQLPERRDPGCESASNHDPVTDVSKHLARRRNFIPGGVTIGADRDPTFLGIPAEDTMAQTDLERGHSSTPFHSADCATHPASVPDVAFWRLVPEGGPRGLRQGGGAVAKAGGRRREEKGEAHGLSSGSGRP